MVSFDRSRIVDNLVTEEGIPVFLEFARDVSQKGIEQELTLKFPEAAGLEVLELVLSGS